MQPSLFALGRQASTRGGPGGQLVSAAACIAAPPRSPDLRRAHNAGQEDHPPTWQSVLTFTRVSRARGCSCCCRRCGWGLGLSPPCLPQLEMRLVHLSAITLGCAYCIVVYKFGTAQGGNICSAAESNIATINNCKAAHCRRAKTDLLIWSAASQNAWVPRHRGSQASQVFAKLFSIRGCCATKRPRLDAHTCMPGSPGPEGAFRACCAPRSVKEPREAAGASRACRAPAARARSCGRRRWQLQRTHRKRLPVRCDSGYCTDEGRAAALAARQSLSLTPRALFALWPGPASSAAPRWRSCCPGAHAYVFWGAVYSFPPAKTAVHPRKSTGHMPTQATRPPGGARP